LLPDERRLVAQNPWQDAMTSEQVMLAALTLLLGGCGLFRPEPVEPLVSPYPTPRVWAVPPLRNQSGTPRVDGAVLADHFAHRLANARNIEVLPVNRVLAAMEALHLAEITSPGDAMRLLSTLGADGLVVGVVTAYDPYDPPKMGLALELYVNPRSEAVESLDPRLLTRAATAGAVGPAGPVRLRQPVNAVSAFFDAADPVLREKIQRYGYDRSPTDDDQDAWRRYRISMDLFSEFVSYVMSWRLLQAEHQRLSPPATQPAATASW
jgi:hypothetical protein